MKKRIPGYLAVAATVVLFVVSVGSYSIVPQLILLLTLGGIIAGASIKTAPTWRSGIAFALAIGVGVTAAFMVAFSSDGDLIGTFMAYPYQVTYSMSAIAATFSVIAYAGHFTGRSARSFIKSRSSKKDGH